MIADHKLGETEPFQSLEVHLAVKFVFDHVIWNYTSFKSVKTDYISVKADQISWNRIRAEI